MAIALALSALTGCSAGVRDATPAANPSIRPLTGQSSFIEACDPAEQRLIRLADGRIEPVLICN